MTNCFELVTFAKTGCGKNNGEIREFKQNLLKSEHVKRQQKRWKSDITSYVNLFLSVSLLLKLKTSRATLGTSICFYHFVVIFAHSDRSNKKYG